MYSVRARRVYFFARKARIGDTERVYLECPTDYRYSRTIGGYVRWLPRTIGIRLPYPLSWKWVDLPPEA